MALNSGNVLVAVTGAVYVAAHGATAPADASTALDAAFKDLGYCDDNGVVETRNRSTNTIKGWQNAAVLREVVTEATLTFKFTLVETNADTVGLFYGTTVDSNGKVIIDPAASGGRRAMVLDVVDGEDLIRVYLPEAELTDVGDQKYTSGDAIGYEITITAYAATALSGGSAEKWYSSLAS